VCSSDLKTGRGKTHLAISLAYRAMQNGFDALFANCAELIDDLSCASRDGRLREALTRYVKPHVLVVDEVGYLAYGDDAANVLFHVVNERHIKRRSMVFTTNKHPKRWGPVAARRRPRRGHRRPHPGPRPPPAPRRPLHAHQALGGRRQLERRSGRDRAAHIFWNERLRFSGTYTVREVESAGYRRAARV